MTRWFEDTPEDYTADLGNHLFTQEEIMRFGELHDPQYFHTDPGLAKQSHFGGLIASGWHTAAIGHRKMVDLLFEDDAAQRAEGIEPGVAGPSPGVNDMEFEVPVRPGDTVTYKYSVQSKRVSKSLKGWGLVFNRIEAFNQNGQMVYRCDFVGTIRLKSYRPGLGEKTSFWLAGLPIIGTLLRRR